MVLLFVIDIILLRSFDFFTLFILAVILYRVQAIFFKFCPHLFGLQKAHTTQSQANNQFTLRQSLNERSCFKNYTLSSLILKRWAYFIGRHTQSGVWEKRVFIQHLRGDLFLSLKSTFFPAYRLTITRLRDYVKPTGRLHN